MTAERKKMINFRTSEAEYAMIRRAASVSGYSISDYVRRLALDDAKIKSPATECDIENDGKDQ